VKSTERIDDSPRKLSAYELKRQKNIARNQQRLRELGLESFSSTWSSVKGKKASDSNDEVKEKDKCSDSEEHSEDDDVEEEIVKILDFKKNMKGVRRLKICWSTGLSEWACFDDVEKDNPHLVSDFMDNYEKKSIESDNPHNKTNEENIRKCEHEKYQIGVTYNPEDLSSYFLPNNELYGVKCALCSKAFVNKDPDVTKEIKPNSRKPMFICSNRTTVLKCLHSVCFDCIHQQIILEDSTSGNRLSRARRQVSEK
jgi:hypothetical protein